MTNIEAKRIVTLGKKNDLKILNHPDDLAANRRIVIINGFYYDSARIATEDIINHLC